MATDESRERQAKAVELHLAGATYESIAASVGYAGKSGAFKAVQEGLEALGEAPGMGEAMATELARLDAMLTGLWSKARRGDVNAVDRVLRISERRTQLLAMNRRLSEDEQKEPSGGSKLGNLRSIHGGKSA